MIRKIALEELKPGMYVSGLEKDRPGNVLFFMNNILVKTGGDVMRFREGGYLAAYIETDEKPERPAAPVKSAGGFRAAMKAAAVEHPAVAAPPEVRANPCFTDIDGNAAGRDSAQTAPESKCGLPAHNEDDLVGALLDAAPERRDGGRAGAASGDSVSMKRELRAATSIRAEAEAIVRGFLGSVRNGGGIEAEAVSSTVGKMVDSVIRNQDALSSLVRLKSVDDYTFAHCVNVCILSLSIGRHMGLSREELQDLGVGAILHDVGKVLVPEQLLKKPGALSEDEFTEMKRHAALGDEFLEKSGGISDRARAVAREHHEKFDGTGYNRRLTGKDIHHFARITAVADVYDAMTSNRVYQKGLRPEEAMKRMYGMRGKSFEPEIVERLIKCLGVYPVGTVVKLNTGETAIVHMPNHSRPLQPRVMLLMGKDSSPLAIQQEVDLQEEVGRWIVSSKSRAPIGVVAGGLLV